MKESYRPYSVADLTLLRDSITARMAPHEIAALFPDRAERVIFKKIRYEKNRSYNRTCRGRIFAPIMEPSTTDADAVSANVANRKHDDAFQAALNAAIKAGLEHMPTPAPVDYAEFRPAPFHPAPRMSYGGSPAAQCAELGAA